MSEQTEANSSAAQTLKLRGGVVVTPRCDGKDAYYVIEDRLAGKFYRIGYAEYVFMSLLDGQMPLASVLKKSARVLDDDQYLSEQKATALVQWLVQSQLVTSAGMSEAPAVGPRSSGKPGLLKYNPLSFRIPLLHPDRLIEKIFPAARWLFSSSAVVGWFTIVIAAAVVVANDWPRFARDTTNVFVPNNWFWIMVGWVLLKVVHESAHAVVCKKWGGEVREAGVAMILFMPLAYVDVTSSWRFRSKWRRIATAAAGMYVELLTAAIAIFVWSWTDSTSIAALCVNLAVMASVTTILFNANPLMRFDGYFILSELVNLPNLYTMASQYMRYFWRRYLFGVATTPPRLPKGKATFVRLYAYSSWIWRILVTAGLIVAAATLFRGAGIVLAVFAVIVWWAMPIWGWLKLLTAPRGPTRANRLRFAALVLVGVFVGAAMFFWVPWPITTQAPGIVEYSPLTSVRAKSPGFLRQICVQPGDQVSAGDIIAVLENVELTREHADLELQVAAAEYDSRIHAHGQQMAAYQAQQTDIEAIEKKLASKQSEIDNLVLRAERAGQVLGRDLDQQIGQYFQTGDRLLAVGNMDAKEIALSISQQDLDRFKSKLGRDVHLNLPGNRALYGKLQSIDPRASARPPHRSLLATYGGPLQAEMSQDADQNQIEQLVTPRFVATIELAPEHGNALRAGQRGTASVSSDITVGRYLHQAVTEWMRERLKN
jgi:putative peptide zinc metalloprotease protein